MYECFDVHFAVELTQATAFMRRRIEVFSIHKNCGTSKGWTVCGMDVRDVEKDIHESECRESISCTIVRDFDGHNADAGSGRFATEFRRSHESCLHNTRIEFAHRNVQHRHALRKPIAVNSHNRAAKCRASYRSEGCYENLR